MTLTLDVPVTRPALFQLVGVVALMTTDGLDTWFTIRWLPESQAQVGRAWEARTSVILATATPTASGASPRGLFRLSGLDGDTVCINGPPPIALGDHLWLELAART